MKTKATLLILFSSLSACVTQPELIKPDTSPEANKEIELYFNSQEFWPQNGEVEHAKHGRMAATVEPYLSDYTICQREVFSGKSFVFGSLTISDPKKLRQFVNDFHINLLAHKLPDSDERRQDAIKQIFYHPSFFENYKKIGPLVPRTVDCVKEKGWTYLKSNQ